MSNTWLLIDVQYLAHRAKHAMGYLSYGKTPTGVVFGVLHDIVSLQAQFHTDKIAFCFDSKTSLRKDLYPQYKAKRYVENASEEDIKFEIGFRDQIIRLRKKYLPAIGYRNIFWKRGYEADDHLAVLAKSFSDTKTKRPYDTDKAILITADRDLFQCLSAEVDMYSPRDKQLITFESFYTKYGMLPEQWAEVKTIAGCTTDNVEGVPGVGERTAVKYLLGTLPDSYKTYKAVTSKEGQKIITRNRKLVMLPFPGLSVPQLQPDVPSIKGWHAVCRWLGFKSMMNNFNPFPMQSRKGRR